MADAVAERSGAEGPRVRLRPDWRWRLLNELFALFVALLFVLAALLVLLDSAPGHRFIVDQLGKFETASGLRIRVGRIDGSIFGKSTGAGWAGEFVRRCAPRSLQCGKIRLFFADAAKPMINNQKFT